MAKQCCSEPQISTLHDSTCIHASGKHTPCCNRHSLHACAEHHTVQVAAYTSGQLSVSTFDCLLLQHVLWQRPDESRRIADYIMQQLAADDGMQQAEYLLTGACHSACTC